MNETVVLKEQALAWVKKHGNRPVLYSDLTRALITNRAAQRARSALARAELREALFELEAEGLVTLTRTNVTGRGHVGLRVSPSLPHDPKDASTQGGQQ